MVKEISKICMDDINGESSIKDIIKRASEGLSNKEELLEKEKYVSNKINDFNIKLNEFEKIIMNIQESRDEARLIGKELTDIVPSKQDAIDCYKEIKVERNKWNRYLWEIRDLLNGYKNFNKTLCFTNIRLLLKDTSNVKIGQIEKESGVGLGYLSRLEKQGNTTDPSMEFIVTAAKLLKQSIDTLVTVNLTNITPTEKYLINFFQKLKDDTITDKVSWNVETETELNAPESDFNGNPMHPLFEYKEFLIDPLNNTEQKKWDIVFNSHTYGPYTVFCGDSFNIQLKNNIRLYLMNIKKNGYKNDEPNRVIEAWMYVPRSRSQFLLSTKDNKSISNELEILFTVVEERMKHPMVNSEIIEAIDAYMNDDVGIDDADLPF